MRSRYTASCTLTKGGLEMNEKCCETCAHAELGQLGDLPAVVCKRSGAYIGCAISNRHWCQRWEERTE